MAITIHNADMETALEELGRRQVPKVTKHGMIRAILHSALTATEAAPDDPRAWVNPKAAEAEHFAK